MLGADPAPTESGTSRLLTYIGNNSERVQLRVKASFTQDKKKRLSLRFWGQDQRLSCLLPYWLQVSQDATAKAAKAHLQVDVGELVSCVPD